MFTSNLSIPFNVLLINLMVKNYLSNTNHLSHMTTLVWAIICIKNASIDINASIEAYKQV